jgi:peptidoglycan/LPS O-acetylase OafA/YrhL
MQAAGPSRARTIAFRVVVIVFALGALLGLFGVGVVLAFLDNQDGEIHRVHDMAFGVLSGAIVTVGLLAQLRRPERQTSAFYQIGVAALAALVAGLVAGDPGLGVFFFLALVVGMGILVWLHPARGALRAAAGGLSPVLAGLAAVGAVPALWFALTTSRFQRDFPATDPHVKMSHWTVMTAMLLVLVLAAFLAAMRYPGWRVTAWSVGAGAFLYGLASTVYPHHAGSKGVGWGVAAMAFGAVFVGAAEWVARSRSPG